jgi:hypothetical protein
MKTHLIVLPNVVAGIIQELVPIIVVIQKGSNVSNPKKPKKPKKPKPKSDPMDNDHAEEPKNEAK